ncbi:glycosyltransferase family 2 protein [Anaerostipes faecalis]|uniref:glycosyltransferase family 2 protein n=1 Tax=Anaerostipes faecalis TaxID=2738446 RepID=UPI003EFFCACB
MNKQITNRMVSIIIPIHNSALYLSKCLESVIAQTYDNIEILCIDDGSTDNSQDIVKKYAFEDHRIKVVSKENEGVSIARNTGLSMAQGEYLLFVDSDDWIEENTCEMAVKKITDENADIVLWSYIREREDGSSKKRIFDTDVIFSEEETKEKLHRRMIGIVGDELAQPENADALCTVWGKLYRRSLISAFDISFYDIRKIGTYEDGLFNLLYFEHVKKAVFLNQFLYHYRRTNAVSITGGYNPNLLNQWEKLFNIMSSYIKQNDLGKEYKEALYNRIALSLIPMGINEMLHQCSSRRKIKCIRKIICRNEYLASVKKLEIQYMPIYWKVFFRSAQHGNAVIVFFLLVVIQKIRGK